MGCPPRVVRGSALQALIASGVNQTVRLPRARRPASYSAQLVPRCRCFGMWRRQAVLALNGTAGVQVSGKGPSSYTAQLPTPTGRSVQQGDYVCQRSASSLLASRGICCIGGKGRAARRLRPAQAAKPKICCIKDCCAGMSPSGYGTHLSLGQHRHHLDAGQRPLRRPEALKAKHGPGQALDPAMVLLDPVIEPAPTSVPGKAPQPAFLLHLAQRAGIALEAVGHNLARVACVLSAEGTIEEALCCLLVPRGAEQKVDRLAGAVDGSVQVAPLPADPDVSLVDVPRPAARTQVAAHPLLQLRGEALNPAVHGRVIDRHAAIGEHPLEVAVADRELQIPAHGPEDHLGREAKAPKRSGGGHGGYSRKGEGRSTAP